MMFDLEPLVLYRHFSRRGAVPTFGVVQLYDIAAFVAGIRLISTASHRLGRRYLNFVCDIVDTLYDCFVYMCGASVQLVR